MTTPFGSEPPPGVLPGLSPPTTASVIENGNGLGTSIWLMIGEDHQEVQEVIGRRDLG